MLPRALGGKERPYEMVAHLLVAVRKLLPGQKPQDVLKEIGNPRSRIYGLLRLISAASLPNRPPSKLELGASRGHLAVTLSAAETSQGAFAVGTANGGRQGMICWCLDTSG